MKIVSLVTDVNLVQIILKYLHINLRVSFIICKFNAYVSIRQRKMMISSSKTLGRCTFKFEKAITYLHFVITVKVFI